MKVFLSVLILFTFGQSLAHGALKTLNCGTPRTQDGSPGTLNYSIGVVLPPTPGVKPKFYLIIESQNPTDLTITEPLVNSGQDSSSWWMFSGQNSSGVVRWDFYEASLRFSDGARANLLCR